MPLVIIDGLTDDAVLQRDTHGKAATTVHGTAPKDVSEAVRVTIYRQECPLPGWDERESGTVANGLWQADLTDLPTGGPYLVVFKAGNESRIVRGVLVGDLWILAGQSNMEGVGDLRDVETASPYVHVLDMANRWHLAEEPLHWLCDSPDSCHCEVTGDTQKRLMADTRATRTKGAGLGLPFAKAMFEATGVPIGLLACAHGGTSMQQWNPDLKHLGGGSLYGSMLNRIRAAGGNVRGLLWYQGESDANPEDAQVFQERFRQLVSAVRADCEAPALSFYWVQLGRFVPEGGPHEPTSWNAIQAHQHTLAGEIPQSGVAPAIDLELDDLIHVGTQGFKRLGRRLARIALANASGNAPTTNGIRLHEVGFNADRTRLTAAYSGVSAKGLLPSNDVRGFSIHRADGTPVNLIYKVETDPTALNVVHLHLIGPPPPRLFLHYGYGLDPFCTLTDWDDMAVPVFGPYAL